jgi:NADH-quinone oxidoreductase subunit N
LTGSAVLFQLSPELSLLVTALGILFLDISFPKKARWLIPLAAIVGVLTGLVLTYTLWGTDAIILRVLSHDSLTFFAYGFVLITMLGLILISTGYLIEVSDNAPFYYALLMLNGLAALLLVATTNIMMLILSLEFLSITAYVLTGFLHYNTRSTEAAIKYLIYGAVITALMLYGISWLYGLTGQTDYAQIADSLTQPGLWFAGHSFSPTLLLPILMFISAGFAFKIAAAPFHQWAPDAYEGAPTPVAAMLATVPKIAGFVVLFRVSVALFPSDTGVGALWHTPLLGLLSASAMLLGSLGGLWQTDVKRMMAYSGITQAGYALMGLATGSILGVEAQFVYLFAYVIAELGIFAVISNVTVREELTDLAEFRGLYHRSPQLALIMIIALLSLTGLPGTIGFIGKFTLFSACLETGNLWLAVVGVVNTVISFAYYWKLIRVMWLETADLLPVVKIRKATIPVLVLSLIGIVGIGLFPSYLVRLVSLTLQYFR